MLRPIISSPKVPVPRGRGGGTARETQDLGGEVKRVLAVIYIYIYICICIEREREIISVNPPMLCRRLSQPQVAQCHSFSHHGCLRPALLSRPRLCRPRWCFITYLPTYLPTCLPAYLPTYLPACLPAYLPTFLPS